MMFGELTPSFTVSAGVRYEYTSPGVDVRDRANLYDVATGTLAPVGQGDMPRSGYASDRNNFAPRLGVSWTVANDTVVRAAYGIYYDQSALAPSEGLYFSPPYYDFRTFVATAAISAVPERSVPRATIRFRCLDQRSRFSAICALLICSNGISTFSAAWAADVCWS